VSWIGETTRSGLDRYNPFLYIARLSDGRFWVAALLAPAIIIVALIVIYPTIYGITLSFREMRLLRPDLGTGFVGLRHYVDMLHDQLFWASLINTAIWVVLAILLELALGLVSALALNRSLPGLKLIGVLVLLPWFLPNVVAGNMWALMLDSRLGVINDLLVRVGLLDAYKAWFADPTTAFGAAILVEAWHGFPFFTLFIMAALKGIPEDQYEAAAVDGASRLQVFRWVTMPALKTVVVISVILHVITLVNSPDLLLILTNGGPGNSTMVLSLYAFEKAYADFNFGYSAALSVVMLALLLLFAYLYVRASNLLANQ
jgi:multiple sugar transport system permease protein